jgi:hypothetical protein
MLIYCKSQEALFRNAINRVRVASSHQSEIRQIPQVGIDWYLMCQLVSIVPTHANHVQKQTRNDSPTLSFRPQGSARF